MLVKELAARAGKANRRKKRVAVISGREGGVGIRSKEGEKQVLFFRF